MIQQATLANACFWCTDTIYSRLHGVISTKPGYSGGAIKNPSYREVCQGTTGHAECIQIEYDDTLIDYATLLEVFFDTHDPTTLNKPVSYTHLTLPTKRIV